ncbi:MAG: hypothetical protein ACQEQO_07035 [Thermodesulfobacteriota bacterium]
MGFFSSRAPGLVFSATYPWGSFAISEREALRAGATSHFKKVHRLSCNDKNCHVFQSSKSRPSLRKYQFCKAPNTEMKPDGIGANNLARNIKYSAVWIYCKILCFL